MFAETDWPAIIDKIGSYIIQALTLLLAWWAKTSASSASKKAGEAKVSADDAKKEVKASRVEARQDLAVQTAVIKDVPTEEASHMMNAKADESMKL